MAEYIEREAAGKIASMFFTMSMCASEDECRAMNRAARIIEKRIDSIPAADVVPVVHGRWISDHPTRRGDVVRVDPDGCPVESCHCSVCGDWLTASDEYPVIGRYCPNCGALMEDGDGDV